MKTKANQEIFDFALRNAKVANHTVLFGGGKIASDAFLAKLTSGTVDADMLAEANRVCESAFRSYANSVRHPELRGNWNLKRHDNALKLSGSIQYALETLLKAQKDGDQTDD